MKPLGKFDSRTIEENVLDFWETEHIYKLIQEAEPKDKVWRFIDGPPYTTGDVHLGTAWNKIMKDYLIRYKRMQGFRVTDTPGYDTHGLPIEVVIEKKLGIQNKKEIYEHGLDTFIAECREFAESKIGDMNNQFKRLGCVFWNWDNPYVTLTNTYIQGIWWTLKEAWKRGYLYKFFKPQNCCPRCATALAKHEFEYYTVEDNAIYVKFQSVEDPKTFFLIWTTTPWTLISNTNIMVNPDDEYARIQVKDEVWIMGMAATSDLLQNKLNLIRGAEDGFEYLERFQGIELEGKRYIHPFIDEIPYQAELEQQMDKVHTVVLSKEYVKEGEGVGIVHTAPGHGPEDFEVGMSYGIPIFSPVDMNGQYTDQAGYFVGKSVLDVNDEIIEMLREKGTLVYTQKIEHEYAHCWRCKTRLVYRATEQWFFKTSALRYKMLEENEKIQWIPDWAGNVNFKGWLTAIGDWCISRQRFWGVPLSIWICDNKECGETDVIGSMEELREKAGDCPEDLHIPWIDAPTWTCPKCGSGVMRRVPDVLDVWLDSGSVMWASQSFVDGAEHYDSWEPADFILEGKDQIRGWFNSLLCSAMVSSERANYNACYMHGWVTSHGTKMSKSLGNAITPTDVIEGDIEILTEEEKARLQAEAANLKTSKLAEHSKKEEKEGKKQKDKPRKLIKDDPHWSLVKGIETFRFYSVMGTPPGKDLNFDYKEYTDTFKILNTFWNSYLYAQEKMNLNSFDPKKHIFTVEELGLADKWVLSRTNSLIQEVTDLFDKYQLPDIPARLQDYIVNDLSRWYIIMIRDRVDFSSEDPLKYPTLAVLWYILYRLCLLMAPINPMLTEHIYQNMFRPHLGKNAPKSIHLQSWPEVDKDYINIDIEAQMKMAREIIDEVRSLKTESGIKLRWPSKGLYLMPKEDQDVLSFKDLIADMANVKDVIITSEEIERDTVKSKDLAKLKIFLDIEESGELQEERIIKDLLRTIQFLRKQNSFQSGEEISIQLSTAVPFVKTALEHNAGVISSKITAKSVEILDDPLSEEENWVFHEFHLCLAENCYAMVRDSNAKKILSGKSVVCNFCESNITTDTLGVIQIKFQKL